jgi:hypothetical protein
MARKTEVDPVAKQWIDTISTYEREFKKWETRVERITKRYRDEGRPTRDAGCRFNILWSNVQTAMPATFSRLPRPDVSRRHKDTDPVGRVAALLLERGLEFEISHYGDYRAAMKAAVLDRFLGGRGTAWARYEPHTRTEAAPAAKSPVDGEAQEGAQVTDTADAPDEATEVLEYECAPTDYVYWKDFGHTIARTWEEVTAVWRRVYMGRDALVERFKEKGHQIPLDTKPEEKKVSGGSEEQYEALIYEIWDKSTGNAIWLSKSLGQVIDTRPDPLGLDDFWPCPPPLYATITSDSLVPIPDFVIYQDQAETLDVIADRIEGLVKALQVKGCHDASIPELGRLFTEGENTTLIPVKNWQAFAEKQGLKGAISLVDLKPIADALDVLYKAAEQQKAQIYELTGLSDIIRGSTDPRETATAQEQKGNWGSMRLRQTQDEVALFATALLRIRAQIMCGQFTPETLAKIGGAETLSEEDQALVPQAIQLLKSASLRDFRIDIVADSMIYMDELREKQDRMEFLTAMGGFLKEAVPAVQQAPQLGPVVAETLKFAAGTFKVGKTIEGAFDTLADQLKQQAADPQDKPDPEMAKVQAQAQAKSQELQAKAQYDQFKAQLDAQTAQAQQQAQAQQDAQAQQMQAQREAQKAQLDAQLEQHRANLEAASKAQELEFKRYEAELKARTAIAVAEISASATLQAAQLRAAQIEAAGGQMKEEANAPVPG